MDESEGHYTKWHKPGTKAIDYDLSYILDLKQSNSQKERENGYHQGYWERVIKGLQL
jgi:hypothetical protein